MGGRTRRTTGDLVWVRTLVRVLEQERDLALAPRPLEHVAALALAAELLNGRVPHAASEAALALLLELLHVDLIVHTAVLPNQPYEIGAFHLLPAQPRDELVDLVDKRVEALAELGVVDLAVLVHVVFTEEVHLVQ